MADKYHDEWIIRQRATVYRICMAEDRAFRFMLNSLYGYMVGGGHDGL